MRHLVDSCVAMFKSDMNPTAAQTPCLHRKVNIAQILLRHLVGSGFAFFDQIRILIVSKTLNFFFKKYVLTFWEAPPNFASMQ